MVGAQTRSGRSSAVINPRFTFLTPRASSNRPSGPKLEELHHRSFDENAASLSKWSPLLWPRAVMLPPHPFLSNASSLGIGTPTNASPKFWKLSPEDVQELGLEVHCSIMTTHLPTNPKMTDFLAQQQVQLLGNPPYSTDLAPCDFFVFPHIKRKMRGIRFESPEAAVQTFVDHLEAVPTSDWSSCFKTWFERMQRCIETSGEYFEKM